MYIEELSSKSSNKYVTVKMSYDDIKNISNALYYLTSNKNISDDIRNKYKETYNDCRQIFDLLKNGKIQQETLIKVYE